jgi:hypothetical protein
LAVWRDEQELAKRARIAERFLTLRKPLKQEQLVRWVEEASEEFGIESSEMWKWLAKL